MIYLILLSHENGSHSLVTFRDGSLMAFQSQSPNMEEFIKSLQGVNWGNQGKIIDARRLLVEGPGTITIMNDFMETTAVSEIRSWFKVSLGAFVHELWLRFRRRINHQSWRYESKRSIDKLAQRDRKI